MNFKLSNGQPHFWQWDSGQKLQLAGNAAEIHYNGIDGTVAVDEDGWAAVPDELLQQSGTLLGWAYLTDHTIERFTVGVRPRKKPPDYVYSPTEIKRWTELEARLKELEESGVPQDKISAAVETYLKENPLEETDPTVPEMLKKLYSGKTTWFTKELKEEATSIEINVKMLAFDATVEVPASSTTAAVGVDLYNKNGRLGYVWLQSVIYSADRWIRIALLDRGISRTLGATAAAELGYRGAAWYECVNTISTNDLPATRLTLTAKNNAKFPAGTKIEFSYIAADN